MAQRAVAEGLIPAYARMGLLLKPVPVVPWVDPSVRGDEEYLGNSHNINAG